MHRVRLFSDDSYKMCGDGVFNIVTAGVALIGDRHALRAALLEAEDCSGKGDKDWHETKEPVTRERYIEAVLKIQALEGRVFYGARGVRPLKHHGVLRVDTLEAGILALSNNSNHHEIAHEGLPSQGRFALRNALRLRGIKRITMATGGSDKPEIRLVDALSGVIRTGLFTDGFGKSEWMGDVPDWFLKVAG